MGSAVSGNRHVMLNDWEQQKGRVFGGHKLSDARLRGVNSRLQVDRSRKKRRRGAVGVRAQGSAGSRCSRCIASSKTRNQKEYL
jgi:hypothetical protein